MLIYSAKTDDKLKIIFPNYVYTQSSILRTLYGKRLYYASVAVIIFFAH